MTDCHYFPDDTTYTVLFNEIVSYIIKIQSKLF
jgi:hypothetical protein